jgi:hypothetical protein
MDMTAKLRSKRCLILAILLAAFASIATPAHAQTPVLGGMLDPSIDEPNKPFSYFWHPTDVIGTLYAPVAAEVTPEGYLYTGFGELMLFVGIPPEPVNVRIKTLHRGYLPIVQYEFRRHGVKYAVSVLAADLGGPLTGLPVGLMEVRIANEAGQPRAAMLTSAYRFSPPVNHLDGGHAEYRFDQRTDLVPKQYAAGQAAFNPEWKYSFGQGSVLRDGRMLYVYPRTPEPDQFTLSLIDKGFGMYGYLNGPVQGTPDPKHTLHYETPMGLVTYRLALKPGESRTLVFKMPIAPVPVDSPEARLIQEADYATHFQRTVDFWENLVGRKAPLRFPEPKVQETLLANTVFDLLAIDKTGDQYITNVNKFQYHAFCGGSDVSHMRVGFDYMGLTDIARKTVLYSIAYQFPDGSFDKREGGSPYYEFFGWNLWCLGRHYQLTRDDSFLKAVYPGVVKAMAWEMQITHKDPLGLFPPYENIPDDAALQGIRQIGPNIWALHGMRHAIAMAKAIGNRDDAQRFKVESERLRAALEKQLAVQTAASGGWIPPAVEKTLAGNHWDNMMLLYPEPLFDPFDPRVTATIHKSRQGYAEGILGYVFPGAIGRRGNQIVFNSKPGLHYWHTPDNAQNALVRGGSEDQQWAVRDLYALLLHTTSTHVPQEFSTIPWSTRDYSPGDILPDGAASGKIIELMRNMLVREYQNDLYLFSAVSPDWLQPGKTIEVVDEPTTFGPVSAMLRTAADGLEIELAHRFRQPPERVVIRIPWFYEVETATADGHPLAIADGKLKLDPSTRNVTIKGRIRPGTPAMNYEQTVAAYQREYQARYERFLRTGSSD